MTDGESHRLTPHLWIVGAGRVGLALGLLLRRAGVLEALSVGGRRPAPPAHPLFTGVPPAADYVAHPALPATVPTAVLLAVPDAEIGNEARRLAELRMAEGIPVLHTSGALGAEVLAPLAERGCSTASLHPLVSVADPVAGAERLRGAWYALEGSGAARELGERLVAAVQGRLLPVRAGAKPLYHAAAVFASNYLVTLQDVAGRLLAQAGVPEEPGRAALAELAAGTLENVARGGTVAALTGPIARGDAETVRRHLARLSPGDRALYSDLARETLALARRQGLSPAAADGLEQLLERGEA